jgi:hypothetical protein
MAAPLVVLGMLLGLPLGFLFRRHVVERSSHPGGTASMMLVLLPLTVAGAGFFEVQTYQGPREEVFHTTATVPVAVEKAWDLIKEVERIDAPKPFLLRIGLPVPKYCVLEQGRLGGRRICYFDDGYIVEEITHWNPPHLMKLKVTEAKLPGRHWLGFMEAVWEFRTEGSGTRLTRTTTITSYLQPSWYWRPLENLGVQAEHEYIIRDLHRRVSAERNVP